MNRKFTTILLATILPLILIVIITVASLNNFKSASSQSSSSSQTTAAVSSDIKNSDNTNAPIDKEKLKKDYISKVQQQFDGLHYKKASEIANEALKTLPEDTELIRLRDESESNYKNPVIYKGKIYHVFFHSLIVYPKMCFTGDSMTQGYNEWMTTVREFKLMIEEMYQRGYTLIDLRDVFKKDASGKVVKQDIYLPKGQKPLIISVDDMSYYKYMEKDGFAKKLVIDEKGNLASLINTPEGKEIVSPDGDVVPILNNFVASNPDFSFKGAKGILALTGYEGILGYRTNQNNPQWQSEKEAVLPVVQKLKDTGWGFASHSYTHRRSFTDGTITLDYLKYDTQKWKKEVGSILGPTNLYISPFGATFPTKDARYRYIIDQGFDVYCGVGSRAYYETYKDSVFMERINLDGYKMTYNPKVLKELFDVSKVYDPARPPFPKK